MQDSAPQSARALTLCQEGRVPTIEEFDRSVELVSRRFFFYLRRISACSLQVHRERERNYDDADYDTIDDERAQRVGLKVADQPRDRGVTH